MKSICVFCGSSPGEGSIYLEKVSELGKILSNDSWKVVYGGASVGLMGKISNSTVENGGNVLGIIPDFLNIREVGNPNIQDLRIVKSMHERKTLMYENSNAFLILPGGAGTMDEFFEVFTWKQLKLHEKPIAIYNINNYYSPLIEMMEKMVSLGFLKRKYLDMVIIDSDISVILAKINSQIEDDNKKKNLNKF